MKIVNMALMTALLLTGYLAYLRPGVQRTESITPKTIPLEDQPLVNPLSGLYKWYDQEIAPLPEPAPDSYRRFFWRELEPQENRYDFSPIEKAAEQAKREGRKFAFRVMCMSSGKGVEVPDYMLPLMPKGWEFKYEGKYDTYVPDWNSPAFLDRSQKLIEELARRYDGDLRIEWVDIGTYGNWGEWHVSRIPYPGPNGAEMITDDNLHRIVDMYVDAFRKTRLIMMTDNTEALAYAMGRSPRIGLKRDSLGNPLFADGLARIPAKWDAMKDRWKTAPFIAEWYNSNDPETFARAIQQVKTFHVATVGNGNLPKKWNELPSEQKEQFLMVGKVAGYRFELSRVRLPASVTAGSAFTVDADWSNAGVTPAYDPWDVTYELVNRRNGEVVWSGKSNLNLEMLLPTQRPVHIHDDFNLPGDIEPGDYNVRVIVLDPFKYYKPMQLAIRGRNNSGGYHLGTVAVRRS